MAYAALAGHCGNQPRDQLGKHGLNILAVTEIDMPDIIPPSLDPSAALRWQGMLVSESPWLHEEVARRMQERLDLIKKQPSSWVHWSPLSGGLQAHELLMQRYPKTPCSMLETTPERAVSLARLLAQPWWQARRWLRAQPRIGTEVEQPVQMLWANMCLHMAADPQALMAQWHRALQVDGFLMFSCLGPDSLMELRTLYRSLGWPEASHEFTDMHDWGDMLVAGGFAEPVMDMERITLTFETPKRLLQELRGLGRNLNVGRFQGLRGRRWYAKLLDALSRMPLQLTFEVVYGHAFKPVARVAISAHSAITLVEMRAALARGKAPARPVPPSGARDE
jgi:malonyl-CoA O-methyltransferase